MPAVPRMVFVVDDDERERDALELLIRSFGWPVQAFCSASACLCQVVIDQPDCIVSKLDMPEMDGAQLAAALEADGHSVPIIIMLDGVDNSAMVHRAEAAGAVKVVHKPCWEEVLRQSIRELTPTGDRPMTW